MTLKDCYAVARVLSRNPAIANKLIDEYHFRSGIDKRFLSLIDVVIGFCIVKRLSFNQMISLIL